MTMTATVIRVNLRNLLVMDTATNQEVLVHFRNTRGFSERDHVKITFNGQMTMSIPPQITATSIQRIHHQVPPPQSVPTEIRATIIQRRPNSLLVRNMNNNRQLLVHTPHACHYCARQRIVVKYDSIIMNNPPEVNAIDISPIC